MPARKHAEQWELALRDQLRISVGSPYRVMERRGKTKLDIRFKDGSRQYATLPTTWNRSNVIRIQKDVEQIAALVDTGRSVKEAVEIIVGTDKQAPSAENSSKEIFLRLWEECGAWKIKQELIKETTWEKDYSKTGRRLQKISNPKDAYDLIEQVINAEQRDPKSNRLIYGPMKKGSTSRRRAVEQIVYMLEWGISRKGKHVLSADRWTPPRDLQELKGKTKGKKASIPLFDNEIITFLDSLPVDSKHPRDREAAKRWKFAFQLMAAFGLRPIEIHHLEIRRNGETYLYCNYEKTTGRGKTKARRLECLNNWDKEWNLLERLENKEPLPIPKNKTGQMADMVKDYLKRAKGWMPLAAAGKTSYSFRHGYAWRATEVLGISVRIAAAALGHTPQTHLENYGSWSSQGEVTKAVEAAKRNKKLTKQTNLV